jgi:translation initiation factor 5B
MRIKIIAPNISRAVPGTTILIQCPAGDPLEDLKQKIQTELLQTLSTERNGITVRSSSWAKLNTLLKFLRDDCNLLIPVCHVGIGSVQRKDVLQANVMSESGYPEFAMILAFDVMIDSDTSHLAEELHVRIFTATPLSHLFDQITAHLNDLREAKKREHEFIAVYPCIAQILPQQMLHNRDLFIFEMEVLEGQLKVGTPLCAHLKSLPNNFVDIGVVVGIEQNGTSVNVVTKGSTVSVKVVNETTPAMVSEREFDHQHPIYSRISRESIDTLKQYFRE